MALNSLNGKREQKGAHMSISEKIRGFMAESSWIRKMFEEGIELKKQFGADNVYDFSLGNPNVEPPADLKERVRRIAAQEIPGKHAYMPNAGYADTREAVAATLRECHGTDVSADSVIMTCGAGGALNVALKTLLEPGEEVVVPTPFFVEYQFYVDNAGGATRLVKTKDDFSLDLGALEEAITPRTKAVLINSPNNPTGKVYGEDAIRDLGSLLLEKQKKLGKRLYLLSDEPYAQIVYDDVCVPSVFRAFPNSVIVYSYSKTLSIPGERIGFLAVNPGMEEGAEVLSGMILCNRILGFVNAPAFMQRVVAHSQKARVEVEEYRRKRDLLCDGLRDAGYEFHKPEGAFYLFPRTPIADDVAFVRALQKRRILTVPGSGFGGPGHFRIAYCVEDKTILGAMEGFRKTMQEFR